MPFYDVIKSRSDVVRYEGDQKYSIDKVTVPDGSTCELGEVLGELTANGDHVPLNPAAGDGSEVAKSVAVTEKTNSSGAAYVYVVARHAIVNDPHLVWPDGITANEKAAAIAQLKAEGIVVDES